MSHSALGNICPEVYNTTQDKVLTLNTNTQANDVVVVYCAGYATTDQTLVGVTDSQGNSYATVFEQNDGLGANPTRHVLLAVARMATPLVSTNTITVNLSGTGYTRGWAVARAYRGLNEAIVSSGSNHNGATSDYPAVLGSSLSYSKDGRAFGIVFYPTEYGSTDYWTSPLAQVENYFDSGNFDFFDAGEAVLSGSGSVAIEHDLGFASQWIIAGLVLAERSVFTGGSAIIGL